MKLAAMQLMQQKTSSQENTAALENGEPATSSDSSAQSEPQEKSQSADKTVDSIDGETQIKELSETVASNNDTGTSE